MIQVSNEESIEECNNLNNEIEINGIKTPNKESLMF